MDEAVDAGNFDLFDVEHWASLIRAHDRTMRDVTCLLKYERRQSNEIAAVKEAQSQIEDRLQERKQWFTDYECDDLLRAEHWGDER